MVVLPVKVGFSNQTLPEKHAPAKPLARYRAIEGALASGFVAASYHHAAGTTRTGHSRSPFTYERERTPAKSNQRRSRFGATCWLTGNFVDVYFLAFCRPSFGVLAPNSDERGAPCQHQFGRRRGRFSLVISPESSDTSSR